MPQTRYHVESLEQFPEFAFEQGWTDGLPVFPPTREVVQRMLDYVGRDPDEVIGTVFPGDGEATVRNVAANCAMAGCLAEYVPVVIAAVECIVDRELLITTTQSTGSASLCTIVTGPAVSRLKFHTREWVFGPNGGRANATIGRAVRLVLWNIGRAHPGKLIKGTMGHPASWSYCIGEEQELTPWPPMHVDFGLEAAAWRSSDLWADTRLTRRVTVAQPLDLALFHATEESWGAHVGVVVGEGWILHLCAEVGRPAVWSMAEFAARERYRTLLGFKRMR